jgi:archaellum biogenesis ATPase FlaH
MKEGYEVVAVNYWKSVNNEFRKITLDFWNTLLLIHDSLEFKEIAGFVNKFPYPGKILYVSLTKTNDAIKPHFKNLKSKIFVIDCVSSMIFEKKETQGCIFEPTPSSLNEMIELIEKYSKKIEPDIIILDSLSQFIDFSSISSSKGRELYGFLDYLKSRYSRTPYRFIILYDNTLSKELANLPTTGVDIILKYEVITGRVDWKDEI